MFDLSPEEIIRLSIRAGTVFYCTDARLSSSEPHYFIVINHNPAKDKVILLLCASSQIENVKRLRCYCPKETLVEVKPGEYKDFNAYTIIDCNNVFDTDISKIVEKYVDKKLTIKSDMDPSIVELLRLGFNRSTIIERKFKRLLNNEHGEGE